MKIERETFACSGRVQCTEPGSYLLGVRAMRFKWDTHSSVL